MHSGSSASPSGGEQTSRPKSPVQSFSDIDFASLKKKWVLRTELIEMPCEGSSGDMFYDSTILQFYDQGCSHTPRHAYKVPEEQLILQVWLSWGEEKGKIGRGKEVVVGGGISTTSGISFSSDPKFPLHKPTSVINLLSPARGSSHRETHIINNIHYNTFY